MAPGQCRPCQPRPTQGNVGDRELPHGGARRCRNRHCPKCQGAAAKDWLAARETDLLPVPYYHVVFTLPALVYDILFKASAETLITIAADPKHLGAASASPRSSMHGAPP